MSIPDRTSGLLRMIEDERRNNEAKKAGLLSKAEIREIEEVVIEKEEAKRIVNALGNPFGINKDVLKAIPIGAIGLGSLSLQRFTEHQEQQFKKIAGDVLTPEAVANMRRQLYAGTSAVRKDGLYEQKATGIAIMTPSIIPAFSKSLGAAIDAMTKEDDMAAIERILAPTPEDEDETVLLLDDVSCILDDSDSSEDDWDVDEIDLDRMPF